jgi:uncharacterized protein YkwD
MTTLRLSLGLFLLVGLTACSQSFWERPRVAGQVQPSPYASAPAPRVAPPPASTLPPPQVRPSQTPPPAYAQPAPAQVPTGTSGNTGAQEQQVLQHVNQIRRSQGLRPLAWSDTLHACARAHSEEQCRYGYMGHESPDPSRRTLVQRMHLAGYQGQMYGEVVAWGYDDAQSVVEGWMNSREHRAILVDDEMTEAAFSRVGPYWTGNFGTPRIAPSARYGPPATYAPGLRSPSVSTVPPPPTTRVAPPPPSAAVPSYRPPQPRQPVQQYFAPVQPGPRPAPTYRPPARGG